MRLRRPLSCEAAVSGLRRVAALLLTYAQDLRRLAALLLTHARRGDRRQLRHVAAQLSQAVSVPLAMWGLATMLPRAAVHYREWFAQMWWLAALLFVLTTVMVAMRGLDRLPGIPRTWPDFRAVALPSLGLGLRFAIGCVALGLGLRAAGYHPSLAHAFSAGGALVRAWVVLLLGASAAGATAGHWLRRGAALL